MNWWNEYSVRATESRTTCQNLTLNPKTYTVGFFFLTAHICTGNQLTCCSVHPTDSSKSSTFMLIYGWNQISMGGWNDISLSSWWMLWQLSPPCSTPRRLQPDGGQRPVKALQGSAGGTLRSRWVMDSYKSVPRGSDEEARRNDMCSPRCGCTPAPELEWG